MEKTKQTIRPTTVSGYIKAISGLFITADNPNGIAPKELYVLSVIVDLFRSGKQTTKPGSKLSQADRITISNITNQKVQVTTNYVNMLKRKKALDKNGVPVDILMKDKVEISYERREEQTPV